MKIDCKKMTEDIALDSIKVLPYKEKNDPIHEALTYANIGYYELNITHKVMYITDAVYEFCNKSVDFNGNYYELIDSVSNFDEFILRIQNFISESYLKNNNIDFQIDNKAENTFRCLKMHGEITVDESGNRLIVGTIQDVTEYKQAIQEHDETQYVLTSILDSILMPIIYTDEDDVIIDMNRAAIDMYDITKENLIGEKMSLFYEFCKINYQLINRENIKSDENTINYNLHLLKNGMPYDLSVDKLRIFNIKGETLGRLVIHTDVTSSVQNIKSITKLLKANELSIKIKDFLEQGDNLNEVYDFILSRLQSIIPNADSCCFLVLDDSSNLRIQSSLGYDQEYANTFKVPFVNSFAKRDLRDDYSRAIIVNDIQSRLSNEFPEIDVKNRGFILESNITAPISIDGKLYGILSLDSETNNAFDDVDLNLVDYLRIQLESSIIRHTRMEKVVKYSRTDELTGAFNRRYLIDELDKYINRTVINNEKLSFVFFDINNLKRINDIYGHLAGDFVLKNFSDFIVNDMRKGDMFARCGGDEFVGLFRTSSKADTKHKIKRWITKLTDSEYLFEGNKLDIQFSYGIAMYPDDGRNFETLMKVADKLMYKHKKKIKE